MVRQGLVLDRILAASGDNRSLFAISDVISKKKGQLHHRGQYV